MNLKILIGTKNKTLRTPSEPIRKTDSKIKKLIKDMDETIYAQNGVGLAAPQVGTNLRLILARLNSNTDSEVLVHLINPEIVYFSKETVEEEEGCLSVPKRWGLVNRSKEIIVRFITPKNQPQTLKLEGLNARIVQHEIDHLDGILFTDKAKNIHEKKATEKETTI
ncbi:MAG: peptide deformylase, peptide deformylase [Candidatus Peregrinibacteria bacterium GW2011_GWF2_43_17]|nr:MAG: peptide deformylase, peptide deformylase [Candidatus Peregrinibacteria bacterium GW2011_GWF2_43_17]HAU39591.1 peptide deformylase [Candidatus Peregrinibacteria bacterium]